MAPQAAGEQEQQAENDPARSPSTPSCPAASGAGRSPRSTARAANGAISEPIPPAAAPERAILPAGPGNSASSTPTLPAAGKDVTQYGVVVDIRPHVRSMSQPAPATITDSTSPHASPRATSATGCVLRSPAPPCPAPASTSSRQTAISRRNTFSGPLSIRCGQRQVRRSCPVHISQASASSAEAEEEERLGMGDGVTR